MFTSLCMSLIVWFLALGVADSYSFFFPEDGRVHYVSTWLPAWEICFRRHPTLQSTRVLILMTRLLLFAFLRKRRNLSTQDFMYAMGFAAGRLLL